MRFDDFLSWFVDKYFFPTMLRGCGTCIEDPGCGQVGTVLYRGYGVYGHATKAQCLGRHFKRGMNQNSCSHPSVHLMSTFFFPLSGCLALDPSPRSPREI